jgi:hypothetical protein
MEIHVTNVYILYREYSRGKKKLNEVHNSHTIEKASGNRIFRLMLIQSKGSLKKGWKTVLKTG